MFGLVGLDFSGVFLLNAGAGNPLTDGITPILTIDVWEHGKN